MSKIICDYCGTLYEPAKGPCPICGGVSEEPIPAEGAKTEPVEEIAAPVTIPVTPAEPVPAPAAEAPKTEPKPEPKPAKPANDMGNTMVVHGKLPGRRKHAAYNNDKKAAPKTETPFENEKAKPEAPAAEPVKPAQEPTQRRPVVNPARAAAAAAAAAVEPKLEPTPAPAPVPAPAPARAPVPAPAPSPVPAAEVDPGLPTAEELMDLPVSDRPLPKALQGGTKRKKKERRNRIICTILAILILLLALYIGYRFAAPYIFSNSAKPTEATADTQASEAPKDCTRIDMAERIISLSAVGETVQLQLTLTPADTEDVVTYVSDNPSAVTVTTDGRVTAVAPGEANIAITCGNVFTSCTVKVELAPETTEPETTELGETTEPVDTTEPETSETETKPTEPDVSTLSLNREGMTLFRKGETFTMHLGDIDNSEVEWTIGNTSVATISATGRVTAVAAGSTYVHAYYKGEEWKCWVLVKIEDDEEDETTSTSSTEPEETTATEATEPEETTATEPEETTGPVSISATDVTIHVGETFTLRLTDGSGNTVSVYWAPNNGSICSADGNTITGLNPGMTEVHCTYQGEDYYCLVRVKE